MAAGFPRDQIATAVAVALAESGGDATAINANANGSTDYGLWQINSIHADDLASGDWRDPYDNARMAYAVWRRAGGWTPWYAWLYGRHLPYAARGYVAAAEAARDPGDHPLIPDFIEDAADQLADVRDLAAGARTGLAVVTDRDTWIRAGMGGAGAALITAGLATLILLFLGAGLGRFTRSLVRKEISRVARS